MSSCDGASPNCHFTCPPGSNWYACPDPPRFVGCCTSAPCNNATSSTCPPLDIRPASFDGAAMFDKIRPGACVNLPSANWFVCNFTESPFLGCCATNPCAGSSCPLEDLRPAAWSASAPDQYELFRDAKSPGNSTSHLSSGAIAGIAVGGMAVFFGILAAIYLLLRCRRRRRGYSSPPPQASQTVSKHYGMYSLLPGEGQSSAN
ncbi:hypothetical protein BDW74DRAFT_150081 [Aspergillus multicolor]|uniref:uncharacterized protein n=1 Tax=Aspergillus multicolor TaxID=41759 RepID=UPI003CCD2DBA